MIYTNTIRLFALVIVKGKQTKELTMPKVNVP